MLIVIDYYAENPIENKIIASSNRFRTIENEPGYDLILTQTDSTKELKILGNDQPITMQVNGDETITIKNGAKQLVVGKDYLTANKDSIELYSDEFLIIKSIQDLIINATNGITQIKGNSIELYSNYSTNINPVVNVISDAVSTGHRIEIRRSNNGRIEINPLGANLRFGAYGGDDIEFYMTTGKIKFPIASSINIQGGATGQVLTDGGSGYLTWTTPSSGSQIQTDTFTSSGTWTKPAWAKRVEVYLVGGGAGGSSGGRQSLSITRSSGAGGMGGAISIGYFDATYLGATESITIGAGGTGGASVTTDNTVGNLGIGGGRTLFGSHFQAPGGLQQTSTAQNASSNQNIFGTNLQSFCFTPPNGGNGNSGGGNPGGNSDFTKSGGGGGYGVGGSTLTQPGGAGSSSQSNGSNRGYFLTQTTGAVGGTNGSNGGDGVGSITAFGILTLGNAGGGGSYATAQSTGRGGDATNYGAGGGGGAASDNGFASGRGGNGSGGMAVVISIG